MTPRELEVPYDRDIDPPESLSQAQIETKAKNILSKMSLEEKIHQMSGDIPFFPGILELGFAYNTRPYPAGANLRLGIPPILFSDGPRGIVVGHSTCFPVSMARGATWDVELEERIGDAIGTEARSQGINFFAGICINLLRHPAWGRAQETYGEDPHLLGEMGTAMIRGVQRHVMGCVKHYAANSMEDARFKVNVMINERALHEVYLPHFKRCVDQGVASVMTAYNKVNGEYCGHNGHLIQEILKTRWGFKGFVVSDFVWGLREAEAAVKAGMDLEMPLVMHYRKKLKSLAERSVVSMTLIDESVLRILKQKIRFASIGEPHRYNKEVVAGPTHRALTLEAAQKSIVLLKNEFIQGSGKKLLPLNVNHLHRILVLGKLAKEPNIGDKGSSQVRPAGVITPYQGIQSLAGKFSEIEYDNGQNLRRAENKARNAEATIIVAGLTFREEGENLRWRGGDRESLTLNTADEILIQAISKVNPRTIVVLMGGSAIITEAWREEVPAIVMTWYPGMEGGHAIADVLFGKVNPSGKLPCTFPKSTDQLPFFAKDADSIEYGLYHGYRLIDKNGYGPAFPFGFGLSYTTFRYSDLEVYQAQVGIDGRAQLSVVVTNTGEVEGDEIVQLYVGCENSRVDRPVKELRGFQRIRISPSQSKKVYFELPVKQLAYYDEEQKSFIVEPTDYQIYVGSSSRNKDLLKRSISIVT